MGKKSRLRKERAEAEKADSSIRIASEGPSSASDADAGADSFSTRTSIIILPFSPSHASILGPAFSPDSPYTPQEDIFLGLDEGGEPRMVVKGSDVYEITKEPASDVYQFVQDPAKSKDIREASPERCTRPLNSSPPPSPPSTSAAGSSSSANKRSKKKAGDSISSISNDMAAPHPRRGPPASDRRAGGVS